MRIGILTQPLYTNYGGIVQCYALQTVLQRMGHETIVLQREFDRKFSLLGALTYYAKHLVKLLLGRKESWHYYVSQEKRDYIAQNTYKFIDKNINPRSKHCYSTEQLKHEVAALNLDAIIVGSDQVWRPYYSPCQPNYFLDFLSDDSKIKRISYAASFGGDEWNWSEKLTRRCRDLLKKFDAVSVREQSGIRLCKEHFGVDAVQVLDPTMLLDKEDYLSIIIPRKERRGQLFSYVLDKSEYKQNIISQVAQKTGMKVFESMPELDSSTYNLYGDIDKAVFPPVEDWLSAFNEADMVVTDSFHGTVFSILFNKPFWVIGNEGRGMARFKTLLSMFGLEDRMITSTERDFSAQIDWEEVNQKRQALKIGSKGYLLNFIK